MIKSTFILLSLSRLSFMKSASGWNELGATPEPFHEYSAYVAFRVWHGNYSIYSAYGLQGLTRQILRLWPFGGSTVRFIALCNPTICWVTYWEWLLIYFFDKCNFIIQKIQFIWPHRAQILIKKVHDLRPKRWTEILMENAKINFFWNVWLRNQIKKRGSGNLLKIRKKLVRRRAEFQWGKNSKKDYENTEKRN